MAKMINCKTCGAQIASNAKSCPSCGAKNKKPIYMRVWFWLLAVVILAAALSSLGGGNKTKKAETAAPSQPSASTDETATSQPPASTDGTAPAEAPEPSNIFNPGDVVETDYLKITYKECDPDWTGYDSYGKPEAEKKIVRAYFIFENIGKSDELVGSWDFSCYADGVSCDSHIFGTEDTLSNESISSGRILQGYIYYEVPENAEKVELEYETDFWSSEKIIFTVG